MWKFLRKWWERFCGWQKSEELYLQVEKEGFTLTGLQKFLKYHHIHRAKIYEAHYLLFLVVPPGTWSDLQNVLQSEWVCSSVRVEVFSTLRWWENRREGIQIFSRVGDRFVMYDPGTGRIE